MPNKHDHGPDCSPSGSPKPCKKKDCKQKEKIEALEKEIEDLRNQLQEFKTQYETEKQELQKKIDELEKNQCCCNNSNTDPGTWVPAADGAVPNGAVLSGPKPKYYVARAKMDSSLVPGKLTPDHKTCWVAWNNTEIKMSQYEVLVNTACQWIAHKSSDAIPAKAVQGGYIQHVNGKETLYIGRAYIGSIMVPGYVFGNNRELLHSSSYTNQRQQEYEILVHV